MASLQSVEKEVLRPSDEKKDSATVKQDQAIVKEINENKVANHDVVASKPIFVAKVDDAHTMSVQEGEVEGNEED